MATATGTYSIASVGDMMIGTCLSSGNIHEVVASYNRDYLTHGEPSIKTYNVIEGVTLTDDEPDDYLSIAWDARGSEGGILEDINGNSYRFAVWR